MVEKGGKSISTGAKCKNLAWGKFAVMTLLFSLTHSKAIMKKWYYTLKTLQVCKDSILYIPLKHRAASN